MSASLFSSKFVRYFCTALAISLSLLVSETLWRTTADELGTIGIGFAQLFADGQANHRGPLVAAARFEVVFLVRACAFREHARRRLHGCLEVCAVRPLSPCVC
jgi:hypothetical protein